MEIQQFKSKYIDKYTYDKGTIRAEEDPTPNGSASYNFSLNNGDFGGMIVISAEVEVDKDGLSVGFEDVPAINETLEDNISYDIAGSITTYLEANMFIDSVKGPGNIVKVKIPFEKGDDAEKLLNKVFG